MNFYTRLMLRFLATFLTTLVIGVALSLFLDNYETIYIKFLTPFPDFAIQRLKIILLSVIWFIMLGLFVYPFVKDGPDN